MSSLVQENNGAYVFAINRQLLLVIAKNYYLVIVL
jgi:hypothetical protein